MKWGEVGGTWERRYWGGMDVLKYVFWKSVLLGRKKRLTKEKNWSRCCEFNDEIKIDM